MKKLIKTKYLGLTAGLLLIMPNVSFAAGCTLPDNSQTKIADVLDYGTCLISSSVIPLIMSLATASFIWGVVQFVINGAEDTEKREKGKMFMIWGILALTVMVGVWGLVSIVGHTFGITNVIPQTVNNSNSGTPPHVLYGGDNGA